MSRGICIMRPMAVIIESLKSLKGLRNDADVAQLLGIKAKTLATMKARNSIPYEELTSFCSREGISLNWLLTGEGLINEPHKGIDLELMSEVIQEVAEVFEEHDLHLPPAKYARLTILYYKIRTKEGKEGKKDKGKILELFGLAA